MKRFPVIIMLLVYSCAPRVITHVSVSKYTGQHSDGFTILDNIIDLPSGSVKLGDLSITERPFQKAARGSYDEVLDLARSEVGKMGGNAMYIISHIPPSTDHPTHCITADVYRIPDLRLILKEEGPTHPDYASIWLYKNSFYPEFTYDVFIDDEWVYLAASDTMTEIRFYESGTHTVWAKIERTSALTIQVDLGKDYYVETSIRNGILSFNPKLLQVSTYAGKDACSNKLLIQKR